MKLYFEVDIVADKVYLIMARMDGAASMQGVWVYTVKDGCVTYRVVTYASLIARVLEDNPHT